MPKKLITFYTHKGNKSVFIEVNAMTISEKLEEKITKKFNRETKVTEWVGGNTYWIKHPNSSLKLKSSSLDELQEMFKCACLNLPVQERKCFFFDKKENYIPR